MSGDSCTEDNGAVQEAADASIAPKEEDTKKNCEADIDAVSSTGSFDPLLAMTYSSSAPSKNEDEASEAPTTNDDEPSEVPKTEDDNSSEVQMKESDVSSFAPSECIEEIMYGPSMDLTERTEDPGSAAGKDEPAADDEPLADVDDEPLAVTNDDANNEPLAAANDEHSAAAKDAASLKLPSVSKSAVSSTPSQEQDASSESTKDEDNESLTSMSESSDDVVVSDSNLQASKEPVDGEPVDEQPPESKPGNARPPLFPRRSKPNASSLRKNMKPGVASFFRSRSNPTKQERSDRSLEGCRKASSLDGRFGAKRSGIPSSDSTIASVHSCSEDTVEVIAVDSRMTVDSGSRAQRDSEDTTTVKSETCDSTSVGVQDVKSETCDSTSVGGQDVKSEACDTTVGVVKDASADADEFSKTVTGIYATFSSKSNEIQDPWPNPWSDSGSLGKLQVADARVNPHIPSTAPPTDSVLANVVGVVLSSGIEGMSAEKKAEQVDEDTTDNILPNPAACNPDLVQASLHEESNNALAQRDSKADSEELPEDEATCTSIETASNSEEKEENPASLEDWKELLTDENASTNGIKNDWKTHKDKAERKGKARKQSSLWKRTKSMVKTRYSNASQQRANQENKKADVAETKKGKGQKFKLGYLCLLGPCKKLSTIKEVDESADSGNTKPIEAKPEQVASSKISQGAEVEKAKKEAEGISHDDLIEILDNDEGYEAHAPPSEKPTAAAEQPAAELTTLEEQKVSDVPYTGVRRFEANIEESKSDLIQLDMAGSKQNSRSWLTDMPSIESLTGQEPQKTFSEMSSIGDMSNDAIGPNMISSINFYVNAASKAVQHNLYDVPVREFEKIREMTCGGGMTDVQPSLLDKGMTATESHDSINVKTNTGKVATNKTTNPFSCVFSELVDVLECGSSTVRRSAVNTKKFEEEKIEMFGSTSRGDAKGDVAF